MAKQDLSSRWRDRVVGTGMADPKQLKRHPLNWRLHSDFQADALKGLLNQVGWIHQAAVVNKRTGRIVDGHLRVELAVKNAEPEIPVTYVDLSEEEEALALAALDSITALANPDDAKLREVLSQAQATDPLLAGFLETLDQEQALTSLADVEGDGGSPNTRAQLGNKPTQIKAVLYADQVAVLEAALKATGQVNRGHALIQICEAYLGDSEIGQFDVPAQGPITF